MNELDVLRTVRTERRLGWGGGKPYSYEDFRKDLGVEDAVEDYLSDTLLSGLFNGRRGADERKLLRRISGRGDREKSARTAVEASLGLPGLFDCQDRVAVVDLLARIDGEPALDPRVVVVTASPAETLGIIRPEARAVERLVEALIHDNRPVQYWSAPFNSGASTVVLGLWPALVPYDSYSAVWILRPSDLDEPYAAEFGRLRQFLHARGYEVDTRPALANAVVAERILLVLLSPSVLDIAGERTPALELLREFKGRSTDEWSGVANILVVGKSEILEKQKIAEDDSLSRPMMGRLSLQGEEAFTEFQAQWKRFAGLRDEMASELSGSRMRRAGTYFRIENKGAVWPISVKLRALFASSVRGASYFDPTQGLRRLVGDVYGRFEDIAGYVEDVSDYIRYLRHNDATAGGGSRRKRRHFYLLQYVSTGLHWLTEEALNDLINKIDPDRPNRLKLETEKKRMEALKPIVSVVHHRKSKTEDGELRAPGKDIVGVRYFASIGVKAIVQDDWISAEPYLRSLAHYRIARRLKDHENDKQLLSREFPYEPHWGRSRIFFVAEAIRHLVRSSETFVGKAAVMPAKQGQAFPVAPTPEAQGTDPVEIINYCYSVLYQDLLNGNANSNGSRSLAKRYGAYQLSVEMLELLSEGYEVGVPHKSLDPSRRHEFMRECGFALVDVGELVRARQTFALARTEASAAAAAIEATVSDATAAEIELNALAVLLDLALVDCVSGTLATAKEALAEARAGILALHAGPRALPNLQYGLLRKLYRRLLTREAHLAFLNGDPARALDLLDMIENKLRWSVYREGDGHSREVLVPLLAGPLEAEQIHLQVAALHGAGAGLAGADSLGLNICLREMLHAQSNGLHHQAMGFRIAVARCFRREGRLDLAEVLLDAVHQDLLRYGCSERTFLSFLNEAGRVVGGRGDPIRAYATYLKPCLVRAKVRGFRREAQQAATQAAEMLQAIKNASASAQSAAGGSADAWRARLDAAVLDHRKLVANTETLFSGDFQERDPLYAYAIADAQKVILSLTDPTAIEAELQNILAFVLT